MTAEEIITELQKYPGNTPVYINDPDEGQRLPILCVELISDEERNEIVIYPR